jgi:hypothetical protein
MSQNGTVVREKERSSSEMRWEPKQGVAIMHGSSSSTFRQGVCVCARVCMCMCAMTCARGSQASAFALPLVVLVVAHMSEFTRVEEGLLLLNQLHLFM